MNALTIIVPAVVLLFGSVVGPLLVAGQSNRNAERRQAAEWKRQDDLAAQAAAEAKAERDENRRLLEDVVVGNKENHFLLNSQMTAAIEAELSATELNLVLLRQIVGRNGVGDPDTVADAKATVTTTEKRIASLKANLADRQRQTALAEAQAGVTE